MLRVVKTSVYINYRNSCVNSVRSQSGTPHHNDSSSWRVTEAYAGKSVFITGGTGFLGVVLIESLLYHCRDIKKIYVLIRNNKTMNSDQRLKQMLDIPLFSRLRSIRPQVMNKLVAVEGDLLDADLGIKPAVQRELEEKVSIVMHSAARVKLNSTLKDAVEANYEGTKKVLNLGKRMKNLETFVHISTAFAHIDKRAVAEKLYSYPIKMEEVYRTIETHRDNQAEIKKHIGSSFNNYTFSKKLTENLVEEERGDMSTIIIRPSIVTAMSKEPLKGWLNSWIAAPALMSDVSRGLISVAYGNEKVIGSILPVDYICNLIIAASAKGNTTKDILVYNVCTSCTNPITWKQFSDLFTEAKLKNDPDSDDLKPRKLVMVDSPIMVTILTLIRDVIPAFFADMYLRINGQPPRHMKLQKRAFAIRDFMRPVTRDHFKVSSTRAQALAQSLHDEDKVRFPCDTSKIVWNEYIPILQRGMQEFLLGHLIRMTLPVGESQRHMPASLSSSLAVLDSLEWHVKLQKRARLNRDFMRPLVRGTFLVSSTRAQALAQSLHDEDKVRFPCDTSKIVWNEYIPILQRGIQHFMLGKK